MRPRILVVRFSSLGDVILASPAVLNLRIAYPEAYIVFLTKAKYAAVAGLMPGVDAVESIANDASVADTFQKALELDRHDFDILVDLHGNLRSAYLYTTVTADQKIRYPKRRWERFEISRRYGKKIPDRWPHTIDLYNGAVEQLGATTAAFRPVLSVPGSDTGGLGIGDTPQRSPIIGFAAGAAHPTKQYPIGRLVETARLLQDAARAHSRWIITANEAGPLKDNLGPDAQGTELLIDRPIPELAARIAECDLVVANDSGIMHLASAVGSPVLGLFGPTHPALGFAPRGQFDAVIEVDEYCRPCSRHGQKRCFRKEQFCFNRITPEIITEQALNILDDRRDLSPALLVDRDGTVIVDKRFLADPDDIDFETGAVEGLRMARSLGYRIVIVSNQSGVARGYFGTDSVERVNRHLVEALTAEGVTVDGVYYCPYFKGGSIPQYSIEAGCRKPAPGMAEEAARHLGLNLRRSVVVGDKRDDFFLGQVIGARSIMVRTGKGAEESNRLPTKYVQNGRSIVGNLREAIKLLADSVVTAGR